MLGLKLGLLHLTEAPVEINASVFIEERMLFFACVCSRIQNNNWHIQLCVKNLKIVQNFLILTVSDSIRTRTHGSTKALSSLIQISFFSKGLFKPNLPTDLESA